MNRRRRHHLISPWSSEDRCINSGGGRDTLTFFHDVGLHARLLVALPLLTMFSLEQLLGQALKMLF